jgi:hypothetical protein
METCPLSILTDAIDRLLEARHHLSEAKDLYHEPEKYRYSTNAFLRTIKEVPHLISQEIQNDPEYASKVKPIIGELRKDALFQTLSKKRDYIVHRTQLDYRSTCTVGATEIRVDKISVTFPISPKESSVDAYFRFLDICKNNPSFFNLFGPDCDSIPFVKRGWKIEEFDDDFFDVCSSLFDSVTETINTILKKKGAIALDRYKLKVGKSSEINKLLFDRDQFFEYMKNESQSGAYGNNAGEKLKIYLPPLGVTEQDTRDK